MTDLLEKAFAAVSDLPEDEQDRIAAFLLDEFRSERRWSQTFGESQGALKSLADETRSAYRKGETQRLDSDRL
jgi:hypothetical protein